MTAAGSAPVLFQARRQAWQKYAISRIDSNRCQNCKVSTCFSDYILLL
jgi:hypothetical protein